MAKHTFDRLYAFVWWRIVTMVMHRHRMTWTALRRRFKRPERLATDRRRRDRVIPHLLGAGHPLPLERDHDPVSLADREHRTSGMSPVESRMR